MKRRDLLLITTLLISACAHQRSAPLTAESSVQDLVSRETRKWDMLFGSAAQRDTALSWYASDMVAVNVTPAGIVRTGAAAMRSGAAAFPQLPAGSFHASDVEVIRSADATIVISYKITGPGPTGSPWHAFIATVWARRGDDWRSVYYQATPID